MHVDVLARLDVGTRSRLVEAFAASFERYTSPDGVAFDASYAVVAARRR